ncbi:MAG: type IV toxin-antitoxin system AbiEi family antitoxin domain-containing protein [Thermomonas sp.]|uniref:type IV toxin-antitoxin system AbiEi family antitoxin domain-containing protein n=1 Tax=Thermomonas sp. TaxID=1971895 RepID=UPI0039E6C3BA
MTTQHDYAPTKTLGPRAAQLFTELYERGRSTFTLSDVEAITGLSTGSARSLVHKAQQRGLVTRLKPGLYNLVPFELGRATEHIDNPYLIARELAGTAVYFLSHATALELHRMTTQPNFTIYTSCTRRVRPQTVGGYDFRFIHINDAQNFGVTKHWVDKERFVMISDMERTIIDGLRHPAYAGGITEIAKGLWMKRDTIQVDRLVDYALRIDVGAVFRRLGFLLEQYKLADADQLETLRAKLTATYQRLDPMMPSEGKFVSRWRLQLNITPEEFDAVRLG